MEVKLQYVELLIAVSKIWESKVEPNYSGHARLQPGAGRCSRVAGDVMRTHNSSA